LTPKYAQIKLHSHNKSIIKHTESKVIKIRIQNEIKFPYAKKQELNRTLCNLHLQAANEWGRSWDIISQNITQKLEQEMQRKYKTIHNKIKKKLTNKTQVNQTKHAFYKRIEKLTNVTFTDAEIQLLDKGLKYNLHGKPKSWI
jgi:hypothetical protein